ncbi:MAG: hypothetical protein OXC37_04215 [Bdellovibrionaceae bacterium]|nr:hypothetical protein [Pseudobdellovibrionaceae bacterium]
MRFFRKVCFVFLCLFSFCSSAKIFRSPYVMFEIGDSWTCKNFGSVSWICHHYLSSSSPPAFILTTARLSNSSEKLKFDIFETEVSPSFLIRPAKKVYINRHVWIDSFYKDRFYKNILSRYQRTICCEGISQKFQVLVSFHAFKENYSQYASSFLKSIRSLNLLTSDLKEIMQLFKESNREKKQEMNDYIQNILFQENFTEPLKKQKKFYQGNFFLLMLFLSFLSVIFLIKKLLKKNSNKKKD